METAPKDLNPAATTCSHHPNMRYSMISLQDNAPVRLYCADCLKGKKNQSDLTSLQKVVSLAAIAQHQETRLKGSQDVDATLKSSLDEVGQIFAEYIDHVRTIEATIKQALTSAFHGKYPSDDTLAQQLGDLVATLQKSLASFSKDHRLRDGPELESYLEKFKTLKDLSSSSDSTASSENIQADAKKAISELKEQLDSLKQTLDSLKQTLEYSATNFIQYIDY